MDILVGGVRVPEPEIGRIDLGISMVSLLCSRFFVSSPHTIVGETPYIFVHIVLPMSDISYHPLSSKRDIEAWSMVKTNTSMSLIRNLQ